jgi:hypothetical protein
MPLKSGHIGSAAFFQIYKDGGAVDGVSYDIY